MFSCMSIGSCSLHPLGEISWKHQQSQSMKILTWNKYHKQWLNKWFNTALKPVVFNSLTPWKLELDKETVQVIPENWASINWTFVLRPEVGASYLNITIRILNSHFGRYFKVFICLESVKEIHRGVENCHLLWLFGRSRGRRCRGSWSRRRRGALLQALSCQVHC